MANRLEVDWTEEKLTDETLLDTFNVVAKELSGLILQGHSDGRLLMFTDDRRRIKRAVYNINENNWGCFCDSSLDGECPASTYARARRMKDLEDQGY